MKTFSVTTLGCKVNQYEGQQIRQFLEQAGLLQAPPDAPADLAIVNSCCITHIASAKSRQCLRKIQKQNPDAAIVLAGCLPAASINELKNISSNIHIVRQKSKITEILQELVWTEVTEKNLSSTNTNVVTYNIKPKKGAKIKDKTRISRIKTHSFQHSNHDITGLSTLTRYKGQHRAFLKVQDGCDAYCSYCIIPQIRRAVCNKNVKTVLTEAKALITAGHKEIVLCGIFLGAYGQDTVRRKQWEPKKLDCLAKLVEKLAQLKGLDRLRLSSLEPGDVTDRLLEVYSKYPNIMPHLHLPLQSGSKKILKKMGRQYTIAQFTQVIEKAKVTLDKPAITTDIIVGFPGETEEDFEKTMKMAKKVEFSKMHVFSFSPRAGTPAAKMQNQVKPEVVKKRSQRLRNLDTRLQKKFKSKFKGQKLQIIIESTEPARGRCERYFMVKANELRGTKKPRLGQLVGGIFEPGTP
jgi:threonylcarbamoyladenosine tRNA methylthiotransferase MtaB